MGTHQADPPGLPHFEWTLLPETHVHHEYKAVYECNWMQALEGDLDTAHVFFLHSRLRQEDTGAGAYHPDRSPKLEVVDTEYGLMYGARRVHAPGLIYWRTTQFLMPVHTLFPAYEDGTVPVHIWVPIDDDHTLVWGVKWHPAQEIANRQPQTRSELIEGVGPMKEEQKGTYYARWWPQANKDNDFFLDREVQRTQSFTGIPAIRLQDAAMTVSMGAVMNRTQEHLGTTDVAIIRARQRLIRAARALAEQGTMPPGTDRPEIFRVRSCSALLPAEVDWRTALDDWHHARTNEVSVAQASAART